MLAVVALLFGTHHYIMSVCRWLCRPPLANLMCKACAKSR